MFFANDILRDTKLQEKLDSLGEIKNKTPKDFIERGFFPFSTNKFHDKIVEILDTPEENINKIIHRIRKTPDICVFSSTVKHLVYQFKLDNLNEYCDQNFKNVMLNYMKNLCKIHAKEFSLENVLDIFRYCDLMQLYSKWIK